MAVNLWVNALILLSTIDNSHRKTHSLTRQCNKINLALFIYSIHFIPSVRGIEIYFHFPFRKKESCFFFSNNNNNNSTNLHNFDFSTPEILNKEKVLDKITLVLEEIEILNNKNSIHIRSDIDTFSKICQKF